MGDEVGCERDRHEFRECGFVMLASEDKKSIKANYVLLTKKVGDSVGLKVGEFEGTAVGCEIETRLDCWRV